MSVSTVGRYGRGLVGGGPLAAGVFGVVLVFVVGLGAAVLTDANALDARAVVALVGLGTVASGGVLIRAAALPAWVPRVALGWALFLAGAYLVVAAARRRDPVAARLGT